MRNKLFKKTDKNEEKQGSGIERKSEMKERSYTDRRRTVRTYTTHFYHNNNES